MTLLCVFCPALATMWVETPDHTVSLCDNHYDSMIESAQKHNLKMNPYVVRSCMERASFPVKSEATP